MPLSEYDGGFKCDECGEPFVPEVGTYIGPANETDQSCGVSVMFDRWLNLCFECNSKREATGKE